MRVSNKGWLLAAALTAVSAQAAQAEIRIAVVGPMTGQLAVLGEQMQIAAERAVMNINEAGGLLGEDVTLLVGDDACDPDPEKAKEVARQFVKAGVSLVAGHLCSGSSIPASEVYDEAGILQISPGSTNPELTEQGFRTVFRVTGRDDQQGVFGADHIVDNDLADRIGIVHDGTAYGRGLAEEFRKQLNRRGVEEAAYLTIEPDQKDYSDVISELEGDDVDLIYVGGLHTETGLIARQSQERGYDVQMMSGDALATDEFWAIAGEAGQGTLMTFPPDPRNNPSSRAQSQVEQFRAAGYDPEGFTLLTYAAIEVWAEAVARAGSTDPGEVSAALRGNSFESVLGDLQFDEKGDLKNTTFVLYEWDDGRYVELNN